MEKKDQGSVSQASILLTYTAMETSVPSHQDLIGRKQILPMPIVNSAHLRPPSNIGMFVMTA